MTTIDDRLHDRPKLRETLRRKLADGLLDEIGVDLPPDPTGDALESFEGARRDALEAIIQRVGRPPLVVRDGAVEIEPDSLVDLPPETDARIAGAHPLIPSVGRIEFRNHDMEWGGTGWVLKAEGRDRIVVTKTGLPDHDAEGLGGTVELGWFSMRVSKPRFCSVAVASSPDCPFTSGICWSRGLPPIMLMPTVTTTVSTARIATTSSQRLTAVLRSGGGA